MRILKDIDLLLGYQRLRGAERSLVQIQSALGIRSPHRIAQLAVARRQVEMRLPVVSVQGRNALLDRQGTFIKGYGLFRLTEVGPFHCCIYVGGPTQPNCQVSASDSRRGLLVAGFGVSQEFQVRAQSSVQIARGNFRAAQSLLRLFDLVVPDPCRRILWIAARAEPAWPIPSGSPPRRHVPA